MDDTLEFSADGRLDQEGTKTSVSPSTGGDEIVAIDKSRNDGKGKNSALPKGVTAKIGGFDLGRIIENLLKNTAPSHVLAQAQEKSQAMRCRVHGKAASLSLRKEGGQAMMAITTCCSGFQKEVAERIFHE